MEGNTFIANLLRIFILLTCPITFLVGLFLLFDANTYTKIENFLSKGKDLSRKYLIEWLEKDRESLQIFLLKNRHAVGAICLINGIGVSYAVLHLFKRI